MTAIAGQPGRMGFFTDTSVCIGCKACEVACKEWNLIPEDGLEWTGESYDNTSALGANSWRHVAFVEQAKPQRIADGSAVDALEIGEDGVSLAQGSPSPLRWLMESDVCKHCTHAGCLDVCPTGSLFRTEFGTVVVQEDICNGCGYCVPACPFGVLDRRHLPRTPDDAPLALPLFGSEEDGRVWKCTLCYDRLKDGHEPACAKACPTDSIQFGEVEELRERAGQRLAKLEGERWNGARLYGHDPDDGVGGFGAFFLLLDEPEVYGLPPDPVVPTRHLPGLWKTTAYAAAAMFAGIAAAFVGGPSVTDSYYGRPILKEPVWTREIPWYLFTGGIAGGSSVLHGFARVTGNHRLARTSLYVGAAADAVSPLLLIRDLGRPERFLNMFRVFKVTSPMSVGSWILLVSGGASNTAAALELAGRLRPAKWAAEVLSFASGPPLATYTGALLANTANPVWSEARDDLPGLFAASATASAGAAAVLFTPPRAAGPARRAAIGGAVLEIALSRRMERRLGFVGEVYRQGDAAKYGRLSKTLSAAGAGLLAWRGERSRATAVTGGALVLAGEAALRWSVFRAGFQSARDPRYTVLPQKERLERRS